MAAKPMAPSSTSQTGIDPHRDCAACTRLRDFRELHRAREPQWHNAPVPTWIDPRGEDKVELLIIGLAPGLRGANRTGRPFTGDYAGDLLYATLAKFGLAEGEYGANPKDGLALRRTAITNAVRCVPPENKPVGAEINNCRPYLERTILRFPRLRALMTLGKISHDSTLRTLGERVAAHPFRHDGSYSVGRYQIFSSYHCSRYNTNTGRLSEAMFEDVFRNIARFLGE
ncbi:MAG: uracil-DNA glycosylase [Rhizobiaceae bacterium]